MGSTCISNVTDIHLDSIQEVVEMLVENLLIYWGIINAHTSQLSKLNRLFVVVLSVYRQSVCLIGQLSSPTAQIVPWHTRYTITRR